MADNIKLEESGSLLEEMGQRISLTLNHAALLCLRDTGNEHKRRRYEDLEALQEIHWKLTSEAKRLGIG